MDSYEKIFQEEKRRFGLADVSWKFKDLSRSLLEGFAPSDKREIWVDDAFGKPSPEEFRRTVRHELWHIKYRGTFWDREVLAILAEFLPLPLTRTRMFTGGKNPDGSRDYKTALIDASIVAGFTFFSTLGGLGATGLLAEPEVGLLAAAISTGISFFGSLMASLQIKKPQPE